MEHQDRGSRAALKLIENDDRDYAYIVSPQGTYLGTVSADSLRSALDGHQGPLGLQHAFLSGLEPIAFDAPWQTCLARWRMHPAPYQSLRATDAWPA